MVLARQPGLRSGLIILTCRKTGYIEAEENKRRAVDLPIGLVIKEDFDTQHSFTRFHIRRSSTRIVVSKASLDERKAEERFATIPFEEEIARHVHFVHSARSGNVYTPIRQDQVQAAASTLDRAASPDLVFEKTMQETYTARVHIDQRGIEGRRSCRTGSRDERFLLKFVSTLKAIISITTREGVIKLI